MFTLNLQEFLIHLTCNSSYLYTQKSNADNSDCEDEGGGAVITAGCGGNGGDNKSESALCTKARMHI